MPSWMDDELRARRRDGLFRARRSVRSSQQTRIRIRKSEYLNFSSNDYLNLAADPRLVRAACRTARQWGSGSGASPLVSGWLSPQRALERTLARWQDTDAALTFSSGYVTNLALLSALSGRGDVVFSDELNHASLIDGVRLGRGSVHIYRHRDLNHLESLLTRHARLARRRIIVTDAVFSMDGTVCPLAELIILAERFDALLVIDDAHGTGVLGSRGRGVLEQLPIEARGDPDRLIKIGTLSKALGCQGGFVVGPRRTIRWLVNVARPYIYSTAPAPAVCGAARRAVTIAEASEEERRQLRRLTRLLRVGLTGLNYSLVANSDEIPIIPIVVGNSRACLQLARALRHRGMFVPAIRPPTVPEGTARLRVSLTAGHTEADIRALIQALSEASSSEAS